MPTPPLFAAGYSSLPARPLGSDEVAALVARASAANRRTGVTGQLLMIEGDGHVVRYAQWVEGPQDVVLDLLTRISNDARHYDVRLSFVGPVAERRFPAWSMRERRVPREALDRARLWTPEASNLPVRDAAFDVVD
ncbi:BLUF domain-containing protein [Rubrivirga sp. S365]|uniref:BLUF domain-containing protein n=1 Tax=Rubrivirga litoralis TaxID=3075598 RepID=A0ABU3BTD5_9BACT|nr:MULTISPECIES: BLUF domain-containing protein [unclassified Rubrivirga]MDT0632545.1 BLUF domain-containing protein [Rubrivirga sp. F394]MDT7856769.1 BLUF domain-containing protein [Rubrivirga sp. S365]